MNWKVTSSKHARLQGLGTVLLTLYRLRLEIVCNVPDSYFFSFSPCAKSGHISSCPLLEVLQSVLWDQYDVLQVLCY